MDGGMETMAGTGGRCLAATVADTPLGTMLAVFGRQGVCVLAFEDEAGLAVSLRTVCRYYAADGLMWRHQAEWAVRLRGELADYFSGSLRTFSVPTEPVGTPFQQSVWRVLSEIAYGETLTYAQQAARLGRPQAVRAVAAANGRNRLSVMVPCHRVIGSSGRLTGYAGGLWRKRALLDLEAGCLVAER